MILHLRGHCWNEREAAKQEHQLATEARHTMVRQHALNPDYTDRLLAATERQRQAFDRLWQLEREENWSG